MKKIKYYKFPSDEAKTVLKNKKLDANEKFEKIVDIYCEYFKDRVLNYAKDCTLENYYEKLFDENHKYDNNKFHEFFEIEFSNVVYINVIELNETINKLYEDGLKFKNLSSKSTAFVGALTTTTEKMNSVKLDPKVNGAIFKEFYNEVVTIAHKYDKKSTETL